MTDITITSACTRCGACVRICPVRALELPESAQPQYGEKSQKRCIACGHCEAACPTAALTVVDDRLDTAPVRSPDVLLRPDALEGYLRSRRSIRHFRPEPVPQADIERLLETVRYAPTGSNSQGVRWLVIHDTRKVRQLTDLAVDWIQSQSGSGSRLDSHFNIQAMVRSYRKGNDPICRNAPHLVIACTVSDHPTAEVDAIIALTHLDILAPAHGIGTCWAGFFQMATAAWQPLREALELPEGMRPVYPLLLGYPALKYYRPPRRNATTITWR